MAAPPQQGQPMMMPPQPGQQPTPEQIQMMQRQLAIEAQKHGMTIQQYVEQLKMQAMRQHQMQQQMQAQQQQQQQQQQQGGSGQPQQQQQSPPQQQQAPPPQQQQQQQQPQQVPIQPGPPKPEALAMAAFLRSQDLKPRTCIFQEKRKDMFKVKRAIRALHTPAYEKARKKNPLLPPVTDRASAENAFKLLPMSLLALRVSKIPDAADDGHGHAGHSHAAKKKRTKGLWSVRIEQAQEARDEFHYMWMYEGSQWRTKLYAAGALAVILAVVFFPIWPYRLRVGVWYLSMACLGLLALFFAMAIFRLILFVVTMFVAAPGLWLYPNLFEDVGFFDSFKPVWGWQETAEDKLKAKEAKKAKKAAKKAGRKGGFVEEVVEEEGEGEAEEEEQEGEARVEEEEGSGEEVEEEHVIHKEDISGPVGVSSGAQPDERGHGMVQHRGATVEEVEDDE